MAVLCASEAGLSSVVLCVRTLAGWPLCLSVPPTQRFDVLPFACVYAFLHTKSFLTAKDEIPPEVLVLLPVCLTLHLLTFLMAQW